MTRIGIALAILALMTLSANLCAKPAGGHATARSSGSHAVSKVGKPGAKHDSTARPRVSSPKSSNTNRASQGNAVSVKGYTKKDGTRVEPYKRSAPDGTKENNYSTKGNVNPYTGKLGTKDPVKN